MEPHVVFLSIPALRQQDLANMPHVARLMSYRATLVPSFPCVTWPVQANMLTGRLPAEHGVVANGFYWRESRQVEMWTAWNERILAPQVWDVLHEQSADLTSAVWFPMLSKGCGADYVCMPAPVHNPDGSESLWCYTRPQEYYGELLQTLGHFPLQHFWGPLANIRSTAWIVDSAILAARRYRPRFFFLYLPHLDYAAQRTGPDSPPALAAVRELDEVIGRLVEGLAAVYAAEQLVWIAGSEYVVTEVGHVCYPNRVLRRAGLVQVDDSGAGEVLDFESSAAWALADHQLSHIFVRDGDPDVVERVTRLFADEPGIAEVLAGEERAKYALDHDRSGEVILVSEPTSWQAYYWWLDDARRPPFARAVDIHRKPGYDPVELHFDPATRSIPLDAARVRGSHGAPAIEPRQQGVLLASRADVLAGTTLRDVDVASTILRQFGIG